MTAGEKGRRLAAVKEAKMAASKCENRELSQIRESNRNWLSRGRHTMRYPQPALPAVL